MKIFADTKQHAFEFDANFEKDNLVVKNDSGEIQFEIVSLGEGRYSLIKDNLASFIASTVVKPDKRFL